MPEVLAQIGPYRVLHQLGKGGMGVVYRCAHVDTGDEAAVKTVSDLDAEWLGAFRREVHALSRLTHPGIVRVLDHGVQDGVPWYAMELHDGPTLRAQSSTLWSGSMRPHSSDVTAAHLTTQVTLDPSPAADDPALAETRTEPAAPGAPRPAAGGALREALTLAWRLCHPLSFMHGEGLVHRDLKPENIFMRADGSPVIADFGLAARSLSPSGREVLEVDTKVRGTVPYMAPEQVRGDRPDARCDLYALGCILYELLVEQPPFTGKPWNVMWQHVRTPPAPPSSLVEGVPPELDALVMGLLAKAPHERIGYADDVADALAQLGADTSRLHRLPRSQTYLYRPRTMGREPMLERVAPALDAARHDGSGRLVLVAGEPGVGKTRFAVAVGTQAEVAQMRVITGECRPMARSDEARASVAEAPLHPLRSLLTTVADLCMEGGPAETRRLLGERGPVLRRFAPALRTVCPEGEEPRLPPEEARARLFDYLHQTVAALAEDEPLMLVLDDLHHADELTLAFLNALAPKLRDLPVVVLATGRLDQAAALGPLLEQATVQRLTLDRLKPKALGGMVGDMLGMADPPQGFVEFLWRKSAGNPLFVAEYLQTAVAAGVLHREPQQGWRLVDLDVAQARYDELPLPRSRAALAAIRLDQLSPRARELLILAALLGPQFSRHGLERSAAMADAEQLAAQRELLAAQVLEELGGDRLRFPHASMRDAALALIPDELRPGLHRQVALALEGLAPDEAERAAYHGDLGRHWRGADEPLRALGHFQSASDAAEAAYSNAQALDYALAALACARQAGDGVDWARTGTALHERVADLQARAGRDTAARDSFSEALVLSEAAVERARLYRKVGLTHETHRETDAALQAYELAEAALGFPAPGDEAAWQAEWIQLQVRKAWLAYWQGDVAQMDAVLSGVEPLVQGQGSPAQQAQVANLRCNYLLRRDRFRCSDEALGHARQALAAALHDGDLATVSWQRFDLGFTLLLHGSLAEGRAVLAEALDESERIGLLSQRIRCVAYLMVGARRARDLADAQAHAERCLALAEAGQMGDYIAAARANLAWVAWRQGDVTGAQAHAQIAQAHWSKPDARNYPFQWMVRLPALAMQLEAGQAAPLLTTLNALLAATQVRLPDALHDALNAGRTAWAQGRPLDAVQAARDAVAVAERLGYL